MQRSPAAVGYAPAEYNLGNMYYYGRGVPRDGAEALKWYRKAADQGDRYALRVLGGEPTVGTKLFLLVNGFAVPANRLGVVLLHALSLGIDQAKYRFQLWRIPGQRFCGTNGELRRDPASLRVRGSK
jgi:Sel1 repeat